MKLARLYAYWKFFLAIAGAVIVVVSIVYAQYLATKIRRFEIQKIEWFKTALEDYQQEGGQPSFILHDAIITADMEVPMILVNERGIVEDARNYGIEKEKDAQFLQNKVRDLEQKGGAVLTLNDGKKIYYEESPLVVQLRYLPALQILLIGILILLGYVGLNVNRKTQENRIWIGMAKETAHQLGTPLSAILAWVEYLRQHADGNKAVLFAADEIHRDAAKLDLIADRFSKIGAMPELTKTNLHQCLDQIHSYMSARSPKRVTFEFPNPESPPVYADINVHLFEWVLENILRNALDAMEGEGTIRAIIYQDDKFANIEITDTGKGIPSGKHKAVFRPGYTTKKRGWGLGLTLAKRIIESYHNGKIFVKQSVQGKGTTFAIKLPRNNDKLI